VTAPGPTPSQAPAQPGLPVLEDRRPGPGRLVGFILLFLAVAAGLAVFSAFPWAATPPSVALLKVALKHVSAPAEAGAALSREELERLPRHMRPQGGQSGASGTRRDTIVRVTLDGRPLLEKTYRPSGLRHDGPTFVYEELTVPLGRHVLDAALVETGTVPAEASGTPRPERRIVVDMEVRPGQVFLLELSNRQALTLRQGERSLVTEPR
jgi:hypothetical protein